MKNSKMSGQIVEPYAEALMSVAQEHNLTEELGTDLRSLLELWQNSPELASFLGNPIVKAEDKKAVLATILGDESNSYLKNFLMLLVNRRRIMYIDAIAEKYLELLRKLNNVVLAMVTSVAELNEEQKEAIADKVKNLSGASGVEIKTNLDPSLIGGVIIKVGSQVYDTSIRGQLQRISLNLSKMS